MILTAQQARKATADHRQRYGQTVDQWWTDSRINRMRAQAREELMVRGLKSYPKPVETLLTRDALNKLVQHELKVGQGELIQRGLRSWVAAGLPVEKLLTLRARCELVRHELKKDQPTQ